MDIEAELFDSQTQLLLNTVVHDLQNGLGIIDQFARFVLADIGAEHRVAEDVERIICSAQFCQGVIRNLAILNHKGVFNPTEVNIETIVADVFSMLERKLANVRLQTNGNGPATIIADEWQMKQVFMNLIKNAGEAMPEGGVLVIRFKRRDGFLWIEVSDTGSGIAADEIGYVFDLYFTSKEGGSGVGLYIVKEIIHRHGGAIEANSKIGRGTTFVLRLPETQGVQSSGFRVQNSEP